MSEDPLNATVIEREDINDELAIVRIRPDGWEIEPYKPGQFTTLGLPRQEDPDEQPKADSPRARRGRGPRLIRRAYSIASSPNNLDYLEFYLVLVQGGKLTPKLWGSDQGDRVFMDPRIKGEFTLDNVPRGKDLIMVATGTGLAPYVSMYRTYRGTGLWNRLTMVHGVRYLQDLGYREELEQAAKEDDSFFYIPTVSRAEDGEDVPGLRGRVTTAMDPKNYEKITGGKIDPETCHVFLCGNPAMITEQQETLEAKGFVTATRKQPGNIHFERYW
jgi:ferredoxin--NADP+ reductase